MKQHSVWTVAKLTAVIKCGVILLLTAIYPIGYAQPSKQAVTIQQPVLSQEDTALLNTINTIIKDIPGSALTVGINNGYISVSGIVKSPVIAAMIIGDITSVTKNRPVNFDKLILVNGDAISKETLAIGLTQGLLLSSGIYGEKVTTIKAMPVRVSASNNIIFLDGGVDSLEILSKTIIIAQRLAIKFKPPMRVISRMYIRGLVYGT